MRPSLVGREAEVAAIEALLGDELGAATALLLDGPAGIGKTTVWLDGRERARAAGYRVLSCRPAEAEASLPFVSLGDLLDALADEELRTLDASRRGALEAALGRVAPSAQIEPRAVAHATLDLLRTLAADRLLLAIDDLQWLDSATTAVLEFALARLSRPSLRVLLARRSGSEAGAPLGLARANSSWRLAHLRVESFSASDLDRVLRAKLDVALSRPRLLELHRLSGGNPFFAIEIVRAGLPASSSELLAVPDSLGTLLEGRLASLPDAARLAALRAVAASQATRALVERAAGVDALAEALRLGILEQEDERIRPAHPLLASALYGGATPWERRTTHEVLSRLVDDPEERARHLALSTVSADEAVATEVERAAGIAARRGAPEAAARLADHAVRLTPRDLADDRRRRSRTAAGQHYAAGDQERSLAILRVLAEELPDGPERAHVLADMSQSVPSQLECLGLCRQALDEAGADALLRSQLHFLAAASARRATTIAEAVDHARLAARYAEETEDDVERARALAMLGHLEAMGGGDGGIAQLEAAVEIESKLDTLPLHFRPSFLLGITLLYFGQLDRARPLVAAQLERANERGDEVMHGVALSTLAELELRAGNWSRAHRHAYEGAALQEQAAPLQDQAHHVLRAARVAAHMGRIAEAKPVAERLLQLAPQHGDRMAEISARRDLGFMELSVGRPAAVVDLLEPAVRLLVEMGVGLYSAQPLVQDHVEALVALGELERASAANALLERGAALPDRALGERGLALICSARGDYRAAAAAVDRALALHAQLQEPFELGRTLLVQGSIERRAKHRTAARTALTTALELFDTLGAPLWAERTAAELARVPGQPRRDGELSETQRRIAELVVAGHSNKEIGARLSITNRTVEAHLSKVYEQLGVHSRTELASRLGPPA